MNDNNSYEILKEIEKQYGSKAVEDINKTLEPDKEKVFEEDKKKYYIKKYKKSKEKQERVNNIEGCGKCGVIFSPKFIDQVHIKKFGLCYKCYIEHHF